MSAGKPRGKLLGWRDAAAYLGLSERTFRRHVRGHVPCVWVGNRVYYTREDLDAWVEQQKVGESSPGAASGTTSTSGSGTRGSGTISPRAREILGMLQDKPQPSTPRLYPVDGGRKRR